MRHKNMLVNDLYVKYGGQAEVNRDFNKFHQWASKQPEYHELTAISQIVGKRGNRGDSVWAEGFAPTTRRDSPEAGTTDPQAAAEFFKTLLDAVTAAHLLHLRSRSFSQHSALGSFYSELEELTDGLIEAYLGKYGILDNYPDGPSLPTGQPIPFVTALSNYVRNTRGAVSSDSELQNEIDTIQKLIDSTLYKLTNLQ
jgi:hypothetical protein